MQRPVAEHIVDGGSPKDEKQRLAGRERVVRAAGREGLESGRG
jgi:hypothetical protein